LPALRGLERARLLLRLAADVGRHPQAPVHHDGHAGPGLADPARGHVDDGDDPAARRANWNRLHRLAYFAAVCAVLHYLWLAKVGVKDPYWYAAALVMLLGVRVSEWGRRVTRRRRVRAVPASPPVGSRAENPLS